jgi:hypothetical protein
MASVPTPFFNSFLLAHGGEGIVKAFKRVGEIFANYPIAWA